MTTDLSESDKYISVTTDAEDASLGFVNPERITVAVSNKPSRTDTMCAWQRP